MRCSHSFHTALFSLVCLLTCCFIAGPAGAEIYFYVDEDGVYHYSNVPTSPKYVPSPLDFYESPDHVSVDAYDRIIREAADAYGVSFSLVKAVIRAESGFNSEAVSHAGAQGLMQIMPANFETFEVADAFDPEENIHAGTRYLKKLLTRYDGDLHLALAAYNAGPKAVDHYGDIPPYPETQKYVDRVLAYYDRYSQEAHP